MIVDDPGSANTLANDGTTLRWASTSDEFTAQKSAVVVQSLSDPVEPAVAVTFAPSCTVSYPAASDRVSQLPPNTSSELFLLQAAAPFDP